MSTQRYQAIQLITQRQVRKFETAKAVSGITQKVSEYFGTNTFGPAAMKERLPRDAYN